MSIVKATAPPLGGGGGLITWPSTSHSPSSIRLSPKPPLWLATRFLPPSSGHLKATIRRRSLVYVTKPGKLGRGTLGAQMNLFDRLARVIKSYANSFISSVEDPEKILEQTVLEMNDDLIKLRQATAQVLASQKQLENKYKAAQQASDDWYRRAQLALERGEEDLTREALKRRKPYAMNALCFLHFRTRNIILRNGRIYECSRHFCHMVEQPELPSWIKSPENASPLQTHSDDDFILPGTIECKEIQINDSHTSKVFSDSADHVDKISRILNSNHYDFSEDVVLALSSYGIVLSDGTMVGKLLKRFSNNWVPAFGFFRWADEQAGFNLSVEEYNLMVDILGKASQFDIMWILVQELVQRGNIVSLITVGKIMRRLARAGRYSDAIDTFSRIECLGLCKDTTSLNLLLDALCKERSVENAYGAFLVFKAKIPPDAHSFNILIHGWSKAKKFEEAHATMEEMRFHGFQSSIISYTALIEAYCDDKNFHKVDSILKEMRAKHCPPNIVTYTVIMHALGKAKQTEEALCILQMIKEDGCTPDTSFYNSLIYILGKAGRLQDVREIFNEMCEKGIPPDVTTYNTMISCACDYSQEEQAMLLLRKMAENLCRPDFKTYAPLLKLCCKIQRWERLRFLLKDMLERDISLDRGAYTLLTNSLCRSGTLQQACIFFEQMVLKGFLPSHNTYYLLEKKLERKNMKAEKRRIQELISSLKAQILLY